MSERTDRLLTRLSNSLPIIIGLVAIIAFAFAGAIYSTTGGTHQNSGTIGDTIGGVTAPLIGILSAILIYVSFMAQIRANEITRQQASDSLTQTREESNFKYLIEEFNRVKDTIEWYTCDLEKPNSNLSGYLALEYFSNHLSELKNNHHEGKNSLIKAKYLLLTIETMLKEQKLPVSKEFRDIVNSKMTLYYNENLAVTLRTIANWKLEKSENKPTEVQMLLEEVKAGAARLIGLFSEIET